MYRGASIPKSISVHNLQFIAVFLSSLLPILLQATINERKIAITRKLSVYVNMYATSSLISVSIK